jgi:hypothetical protein
MLINEERTKNILKVYEYLLENKLIENKDDFCRKIDLSVIQFDWVQARKICFPVKNLLQFVRAFNVNVNYIYHGKGRMFFGK